MTQSGHGQEGQSWGQPPGQPWGPPPPEGAPGGDPATQYLRPVPPASPQGQAENPAESTQFLGTGFGTQPQQHQPPHQHQHQQPDPDVEATQYIPPVPGRTGPPAEFDNLFRDEPAGAAGAAGATQQMPRYEPPQQQYGHQPPPQPHQQYGQPQPHHQPYGQQPPPQPQQQYGDPHAYDDEPEPRRSSKLPLVAAVVVGCAVLGLGAGALMSGGDDSDSDGKGDKTGIAAATSPAPSASSSEPVADPAKGQAEQLDKLLADSNNSRDAVIRSVENIKKCQELDKAASDLREAAVQRRELVTRLKGIEIDKLPDHAELSTALTKAWQASATADDHYAVWAEQVKKPKNCKDGRARNTSRTAQAAVASGEATNAKRQAARLWNGIAETYGLTTRQPTQL
ncbi:hypothetical protein [Streptomyces sp. TRM49041]|uniref:hypothetical protein n=1 Tax=Streptomyces sp. TRM49041 TaxID=2603216 RepID=UPI0011EF88E1|nr:hypothetical protein [Streptomyces sp. TRM49041]